MANKNRQRADRFAAFGERFEQAQIEAGKKVARTFGKRLQKHRLAQLGGVSARRKDGVTYRVTNRGSLVFLDLAPMAVPQEYGRVITPKSGMYLRVPIGPTNRKRLDEDETFVVKSKSGELVIMRAMGGGKAEAIATLVKKVVIKRSAISGRFAELGEKNLKSYRDELASALIKELDK